MRVSKSFKRIASVLLTLALVFSTMYTVAIADGSGALGASLGTSLGTSGVTVTLSEGGDFGSLSKAQLATAKQTVKVSLGQSINTSATVALSLTGTGADSFALSGSSVTVAPGATNSTRTVKPKSDLAAGSYAAKLVAEWETWDGQPAQAEVALRLTVTATASTKTLSSIAITTPPTKTAYVIGETFDPAGMVVTANYSDDTTAAVPATSYTMMPAAGALLTAANTKVTVTYTEGGVSKTAEVEIAVAPAPQARILVSHGAFDDIGAVLTQMGIKHDQLASSGNGVLRNYDFLKQYDILFLNCGASIWDTDAITKFVAEGGLLYASDLMLGDVIVSAFPEQGITYESMPSQDSTGFVVDGGLQAQLGKKNVDIEYDLGGWHLITGWTGDLRVYLEGTVTSDYGGTASTEKYPFIVSFSHGKGTVFCTSFHNEANLSTDMTNTLEYLVFRMDLNENANKVTGIGKDLGFDNVFPVFGKLEPGKTSKTFAYTAQDQEDFAVVVDNSLGDFLVTLTDPNGNSYTNADPAGTVVSGVPAVLPALAAAAPLELQAVDGALSAPSGVAYSMATAGTTQLNSGMTVTSLGEKGLQVDNAVAGTWSYKLTSQSSDATSFVMAVATSKSTGPDPTPTPTPWTSSRSSRSSGGTAAADTSRGALASGSPAEITATVAKDTAQKAVTAAKQAGAKDAVARIKNPGNISLAALQSMADMAKQAGMTLQLRGDSMVDGVVNVRVQLNPAQSTQKLNLSASTANQQAKKIAARFGKYFSNDVTVVSFGQQGGFGQSASIAAKMNADVDTSGLVLYSYNAETNTVQKLSTQSYWMDQSGYIHFTTAVGGDIVISDGALAKK